MCREEVGEMEVLTLAYKHVYTHTETQNKCMCVHKGEGWDGVL